MKRAAMAIFVLLALAGAAHAFGLGMGNRFGKFGAMGGKSSGGGTTNCILVQTGSKLLVNTGSCLLYQ